MTDPNTPSEYPPPPAQQPYASAPPPAYNAPAAGPVPGKTLGIVAFIVSFFFSLIGLILGIVALVQSRKAGVKNGWAVAAIILGSIFLVIGIIVIIAVVAIGGAAAAEFARLCAEYGSGTHDINGVTVTLNCG